MNLSDTIAAISSAHGRAPRGIVRLSGPRTHAALAAVLDHAPETHSAAHARLKLKTSADPASIPTLVLRYAAPHSYTGQDGAELILPGNPHLLARVIDDLCRLEGVRLAEPGEFTARAFLSGKLTAEQAEGVGALIAASNDTEFHAARRLLSGDAGQAYRTLADDIAGLLALLEAELDFAEEEDVRAIDDAELLARLEHIRSRLLDLGASSPRRRQSQDADPVVVLAGAPNAGKSTLYNALLGRVRAVVSDTPGTTRDALAERMDLPRSPFAPSCVTLVDLAGLDAMLSSRSEIDAIAHRAAVDAITRADAVIWCDPTGRFDADTLPPIRVPIIRVRTKADLSSSASSALSVCALDGWNLEALRRAIADAADTSSGVSEHAVLPRHRRALACALAEVRQAHHLIGQRELLAGHLRAALDEIAQLAGEISPDDVLGRIFATFCIGK